MIETDDPADFGNAQIEDISENVFVVRADVPKLTHQAATSVNNSANEVLTGL